MGLLIFVAISRYFAFLNSVNFEHIFPGQKPFKTDIQQRSTAAQNK
jgi:hypothetical protein